jgi:hypothetical protein
MRSSIAAGPFFFRFHAECVVVAVAVFLVILGARTAWLPRRPDCPLGCHPLPGETIGGIVNGEVYLVDGTRYWFLDHIGGKLYTHNVNIDGYVHFIARSLGATTYVPTVLANLAAFCAGLYAAYRFVLKASGDQVFATLFLLLVASEYYFNLLFGLNLRAWQWLGLFGASWALLGVHDPERWRRVAARLGFAGSIIIAFASAYDFAALTFIWLVLLALLGPWDEWNWRLRTRAAGLIVGAFLVPAALRQLQVIGAVGVQTWATDVWYSSLIKTSIMPAIFGPPDLAAVDRWYVDHGLVRYPAAPILGLSSIVDLAQRLFRKVWLPRLGRFDAMVSGIGILCATAASVNHAATTWWGTPKQAKVAGRIIVLFTIASAAAIYLFSPYSIHWAILHAAPPVIIAVLMLAYAFVCWLLARTMARFWRANLRSAAVIVGVLLALLLGERARIQVHNAKRWVRLAATPPAEVFILAPDEIARLRRSGR